MTAAPLLGETTAGEPLAVDVDRLISTRMLLTANSGAGKSWALRRLLEQTHGRIQQLVIDPEGEFYTLRESFDYVLAGRGGDCPAEPRSAALLARRLLELGASAVLDLYELAPRDRVRFVRLFLESLIDAPRDLWHPVLVVIDEAHAYAPEKGHGEAESVEAVARLMAQGRKRGFAGVLATQRLSKLAKDVAAEANNLLIGRAALDVDVKRAADALGISKAEASAQLRSLKPGHFFAFGPALSADVVELVVGEVETSHPRAGKRSAAPAPPREKVKAVLGQLADLPKEAEAEAATIAEARAKVRALERELAAARKAQPAPPPPKVERVEVPVLSEILVDRLERILSKLGEHGENFLATSREVSRELATATTATAGRPPSSRPQPTERGRQSPSSKDSVFGIGREVRAIATRVDRELTGIASALTGPEQRILDAVAWMESIGVDEPEQTAVAFLAGYTYGAGAFNNPRGSLRAKGLVEYLTGGRIRLTETGRASAQAPLAPPSTEELHRRVLDRLPGPEQRLLRPLLESYPDPLSYEDLAAAAGYTAGAGAFNNPRGRLRSLGLIEYDPPGHARARSILFLNGGR